MHDSQSVLNLQLYTLNDDTVTTKSVVYMDDPNLKMSVSLSVNLDMMDRYHEREVLVSIKFGLEIQIVAKDKKGKCYGENAECVFYA